MTATITLTDASSALREDWDNINWSIVKREVHRLQMRIAKATREGRHRKVKSLSLIHISEPTRPY